MLNAPNHNLTPKFMAESLLPYKIMLKQTLDESRRSDFFLLKKEDKKFDEILSSFAKDVGSYILDQYTLIVC